MEKTHYASKPNLLKYIATEFNFYLLDFVKEVDTHWLL
jgi:hypothetical protein